MKYLLLILSGLLSFYFVPFVSAQDSQMIFRQSQPHAYCDQSGNPKVDLKWEDTLGSFNPSYYVHFLDSEVGTIQGGAQAVFTGNHQAVVTKDQGLIPGHQYGFVIKAIISSDSDSGSSTYFSDTDRTPGGWTHSLYGWTIFPQCEASRSPTFSKGDANADGVINIYDFNQLVSQFNKPASSNHQMDFDNNGTINIFDFNQFITQGFSH